MTNETKVGVAICTHNRELLVRLLLDDLLHQTVLPDQLIIIEDVSSSHNLSKKILEELFRNTKIEIIYKSCQYRNIARSRNLVLQYYSADLLINIDDDVRIPKNYIEKVLWLQEKYPDALGFFGKTLPTSPDPVSIVSSYYFNQELSNQENEIMTSSAPFLAVALNTKILRKHNFHFDTYFPIGEDLEFFSNFTQLGEYLIYSPSLTVFHYFSTTGFKLTDFFRRFYRYGKYAAKLHFQKKIYCFEVAYCLPTRKLHLLLFPLFAVHRLVMSTYFFHKRSGLNIIFFLWSMMLHIALLLGINSYIYTNTKEVAAVSSW